ncbi:hypothetical protein Q8F55_002606 [Vanrija albida]|uniref:Uncharacterized protein n=1 Tax=Vanrija albida TaxID=181172 RepID=A0ABR3QAH1_9TREE
MPPPTYSPQHKKAPRRSMDIIQRLNPFAPRPGGRSPLVPDDDGSTFTAVVPTPLPPLPASPATPRASHPSTGVASSVDTDHIPLNEAGPLTEAQLEVLRYRTSTSTSSPRRPPSTSIPDRPPSQSSFLRSLTHHPSFSALKARSRRRKAQAGLPVISGESKSANTTPAKDSPQSAKKEIKRLKTSKSAPRLRVAARLHYEQAPLPPLPDSMRVALYSRPNSQFNGVVGGQEVEPRAPTPGPFSSIRGDPPVLDGGMRAFSPVEEVPRKSATSPLPPHLIPNAPPATPLAPTVTARGKQRQRRMMSSPPRIVSTESTREASPFTPSISPSTYPDMDGDSESALDMSLLGAPSGSHKRGSTSPSNTVGHASPFVHPEARRRLSLDAFGPPPYTNGLSLQVEQLEDLSLERSRQFEDDDDDDFQQVNNSLAISRFRATSLSTIKECSSRSTSHRLSSALGSIGSHSSEPEVASPFLASSSSGKRLARHLRNLSAPAAPPPFLVTRALLEAQSEHTSALKEELVAAQTVIEVLKSEIVELRVQLRETEELKDNAWDTILNKENEIGRLELDNKDLAQSLNQIRVAMAANEEDVDLLKSENNILEKRFRNLSDEMEAILAARQADTKALLNSEASRAQLTATVLSLQKQVAAERKKSNSLEESASSLRSSINSQESDHKSAITERDNQIAQLSLVASAKDAEISHLEEQLATASFAGSERQNNAEVENLLKQYEELQAEFIEKEAASQASREELAELREQRQAWEDDRQAWEEERDELIERVWRLEEDEAASPDVKAENDELQERLAEADAEIERLEQEAEYNKATLDNSKATLAVQEAELEELRQAVATAEDNMLEAQAERDRVIKDSDRALSHLHEKLRDKSEERISLQSSLRVAMDTQETERLRASGAESRVGTYLGEIDRLKLVEAGLKEEIAGLRRASAKDGLQRVELRKRIDDLIAERDLLAVSLDSKEIELAIARRPHSAVGVPGNRLPASAVKPTPSTSRLNSSVSSTRVRSRTSHSPTSSPVSTLTPTSRHNVSEDATPRARADVETPLVAKLSRGVSPSLETPTTRSSSLKPQMRKAAAAPAAALSLSTRSVKATPVPASNLSRRGSLQAVGRVRRPSSLHE